MKRCFILKSISYRSTISFAVDLSRVKMTSCHSPSLRNLPPLTSVKLDKDGDKPGNVTYKLQTLLSDKHNYMIYHFFNKNHLKTF